MDGEERKIHAQFDASCIRVYQAYNPVIADEAIRLGRFGPHFKLERMTWIKPSFLWMMYRCGWATKEGQERVLAIDMKRSAFNSILENVVLSSFRKELYGDYKSWKAQLESSLARCQWDPDRDIHGNPLNRRAIQLGIRGRLVQQYVADWIVKISDITDDVIQMREAIREGTFRDGILPEELEYPVPEQTQRTLGML